MSGISGARAQHNSGIVGKHSAGHIIQIQTANKSSTHAHTSTTFTAVPDLSVTIYPHFKLSSYMIHLSVLLGAHTAFGTFAGVRLTVSQDNAGYVPIALGDASGSRQRIVGWTQAHTANEVEYVGATYIFENSAADKLIFRAETVAQQGTYYAHVNRGGNSANAQYDATGHSSITVMEVAT